MSIKPEGSRHLSPKQQREAAEEMTVMPDTCRSSALSGDLRTLPSRWWDKLAELNPEERTQGKAGQKAGWFMCQRAQLESNGA